MSDDTIERELANDTLDDTADALLTLENDLNELAEHTDAEYVLVKIEPLTKDQHEANQALREYLTERRE